jgi:hypothetical protein
MAKQKVQALPAIDPLFRAFVDRFVVLDGAGRPLALVATEDEETAKRYGLAREPDYASSVCMAVALTEKLWSPEGREKIAYLMGLPVIPSGTPGDPGDPESKRAAQANRVGGYSNTYRRDFASAWREVARGIVTETNESLKSLAVHRPPAAPKPATRPEQRDAANNELMAFEAKAALQFAGAAS